MIRLTLPPTNVLWTFAALFSLLSLTSPGVALWQRLDRRRNGFPCRSILTPFHPALAIAIGIIISCAGFVGDVTLSALKRDLGVKDSGNLLLGHGGVLDRIDSLTYTAPLFFHITVFFYYPGGQLMPGSNSVVDSLMNQLKPLLPHLQLPAF
jgi:CDP-diglyceride synthetase